MRTAAMAMVMLAGMLSAGEAIAADQKGEKPLVSCDAVVDAYKHNQSVDKTAATFLIDQSRVVECLKAAGIAAPKQVDR